jgi:hypothetical protein
MDIIAEEAEARDFIISAVMSLCWGGGLGWSSSCLTVYML